jgi:hypothetical protein
VWTIDNGSETDHGRVEEVELLKLQKSDQFPDDLVKIGVQSHYWDHPDVLAIAGIKEIEFGGLLL